MSKKKARRRKKPDKPGLRRRDRRKAVAIISLILCVLLSGMILARWRVAGIFTRTAAPAAPPQASPTPALAKEYIYAGGRLIATEEPVVASGPAPTGLVAKATSATTVSLEWVAPAGSVNGYRVERSQSINGPYTQLAPDPTATSFTDATASPGVAYLYRVRAAYAGGGFSAYSDKDLATTIIFEDDPLVSVAEAKPGVNVTKMRAIHITELRAAVDAVRVLAALPPVTWTATEADTVTTGALIRAGHVQKLRDNLGPALTALGINAPAYESLVAGATTIKKSHIQELRDLVK